MPSSKERFTLQDLAAAGICATGIRRWFAQRGANLPEGVSFRSFMEHGMSVEEARSLNDGVVDRVLAIKGAVREQ